jgi:uncharacterized membrane protein YtjA (UPF0391 family)
VPNQRATAPAVPATRSCLHGLQRRRPVVSRHRKGTGSAVARFAPAKTSHQRKACTMLKWALIFFIVSIIAGVFGFTGISAATAGIARILFFLFIVIFLVFLVMSLMAGNAIL